MRLLLRTAYLLLLAACLGGFSASAQEALTLRDAIQEALGENPEAKIASAGTREARAAASMARTQLLPQINLTEDISRGTDPVYAFGARLRQQRFTQADFALNALNRPLPLGNFSTRLSGSWLAFDSFRTQKSIHSADLMRKSAESSAKAVNQKIVLNVVEAYQSVLYAERQISIAQHEQQTAEALLSSVEDHVKAGLGLESDRMSAQVNLAARKQERIAAEGALQMAWAELRVAMGTPDHPESPLQPIKDHEFPVATVNDEIQTALKNRSDLKAVNEAQSSQSAALAAAKLAFGPRLSAYGNWEQDRPTFAGSGGNNWVAGVQLGVDLLPFSRRAQLAKEAASKERLDAQVSAYQQQVRLQVTQSHIQRQIARQSVETARAAVDQSAESLRILNNRYTAGLATITDLLRAEDAHRQSQVNYWHAVYGDLMAYAQLLYATGTLTPEAAEELQ